MSNWATCPPSRLVGGRREAPILFRLIIPTLKGGVSEKEKYFCSIDSFRRVGTEIWNISHSQSMH